MHVLGATVREAATALYEELRGAPWLSAVGVGHELGRDLIVVYIKSPKRAWYKRHLPSDSWHGYKVIVRQMGAPRPALEAPGLL